MHGGDASQRRIQDRSPSRRRGLCLPARRGPSWSGRGLPGPGAADMIEAAMIWNEPNNKSHWDPEIDPDWSLFAEMAIAAGKAIKAVNPNLPRVLGGISPIDPLFIANMAGKGVLNNIDVVAVHGFPLDWNLWGIDD